MRWPCAHLEGDTGLRGGLLHRLRDGVAIGVRADDQRDFEAVGIVCLCQQRLSLFDVDLERLALFLVQRPEGAELTPASGPG